MAAQAQRHDLDQRKDVVCNCFALPGAYVLEASTMASGMVYDWFVHAVCQSTDYQSADAGAAASPPGAGGVLALPDLMGRGMAAWDGAARGCWAARRATCSHGCGAAASSAGTCPGR